MSKAFTYTFRVRFAEVDLQSVVFNSRYLEYADLVLTEYWREAGLHFIGEDALEFHVVHAGVDFVQPIRADELIEGRAWTARIGSSSVTTEMELHGAGADDDLRARMHLVHVHVDLATGQPIPVPPSARAALGASAELAHG